MNADDIMTMIPSRPATTRMSDVAQAAGVSLKSVSRVVNKEPNVSDRLRQRVEDAIAQTGFVPDFSARRLAGSKAYSITILKFNVGDANRHNYFMQSYMGAYRACADLGYLVKMAYVPWEEGAPIDKDRVRQLLDAQETDGFLLLAPFSDEMSVIELLEERGLPFARTSPTLSIERGHCVDTDDFQAGADVADHFIDHGHRNFAVLNAPTFHRHATLRSQGFIATIRAKYPDAPITELQGTFLFKSGIECGRTLFAKAAFPIAIFSLNDDMALGVIHAARECGLRVPEDVSVCGFDDSMAAQFMYPPLTTVRQPISAIAEEAARQLLNHSNAESRQSRLPYQFCARGTVADVKPT